jgi:hypothetical protein
MSVRSARWTPRRLRHQGGQLQAPRNSAFRLTAGALAVALVLGGAATMAVSSGSSGDRAGLAARRAAGSAASTPARAGAPHTPSGERIVADALPERIAGSPKLLAASASLPADCIPQPSGPPGAPYQLGVVGTVQNGVLTAGPATVADIKVKFCGVVTVVNGRAPCGATGTVDSPPDGQVFGSLSATLTLVPGMLPTVPFVAHPGTITGGFTCQSSSQNGLAVSLDATVSGSTGLYGLSCTIGPFTIPLSGVLTGRLSDASITLRGDDFSVPVVSASPTCPGEVPANLDQIAGLPLPAGKASATLPATVSLYQPQPFG